MSATPNPTRGQGVRRLKCGNDSDCCWLAARKNWPAFNCGGCPLASGKSLYHATPNDLVEPPVDRGGRGKIASTIEAEQYLRRHAGLWIRSVDLPGVRGITAKHERAAFFARIFNSSKHGLIERRIGMDGYAQYRWPAEGQL